MYLINVGLYYTALRDILGLGELYSFNLTPLGLSWSITGADPESFVRGGQTWGPTMKTLSYLVDKYHNQQGIIVPPAKRSLNGVSLAG